eukprot:Skav236663  [mRNA]  locus=scaffold338:109507:114366:- [translate_table: standard]
MEDGGALPAASVPGSRAPPCSVVQLWNSMARWVLSSSSNFSTFLKSLLSTTPAAEAGTAHPLWPMPVPFPEVWGRSLKKSWCDPGSWARKKSINLLIAALNWLHMGRPKQCPAAVALGARLSGCQWRVVRRFERLQSDVATSGEINAEAMGRTAARVESLDQLLVLLQQQAVSLREAGYEHRLQAQHSSQATSKRPGHDRNDPGVVVGKLSVGAPVQAKSVDASRLSIPTAPPEFDPTVLFEHPHRDVYVDPIKLATDPTQTKLVPPKVRVHASRDQALQFLHFLDEHHRLELVPAKKIRTSHVCGAFTLTKDLQKDRLILDARPPNQLEHTYSSWTRTLGAVQSLMQLELEPHKNLYFSGTDLRDYYYNFRISSRRARRNALKFPITAKQASAFRCFKPDMWQEDRLYPCLKTLAMGDNNAVELGQCAHLQLGLHADIIHPRLLLTTHGRAPRGDLFCGLIIDDIIFGEQLSIPPTLQDPSEGARRLDAMCAEYQRHQLSAHPKKTFRDESTAEFWGAFCCGRKGLVRPSPKRLVPLMALTSRVALLGFATVALLEVLAGSWVSVMQYRRRCLSLLDCIYSAQQGRDSDDIVQLSPALVDELWMLTLVAPVVAGDLRAQSIPAVYLSDASEEAQAVVQCEVPYEFSKELQRHCLSRGGWSKLLSPWKVWKKTHGKLLEHEELPSGVPLVSHPLWLQLAKSLQFEEKMFQRVHKRQHINVLELSTVLMLERRLASDQPDSRYALGADSQVTLACLVKGRSSSPALNSQLQKSLPTMLGGGLWGSYGFVPSLANVADDPTRDRAVRAPSEPVPPWMSRALQGDFFEMDLWLEHQGYDPLRVADLPFAEGRDVRKAALSSELIPNLRAVQKPERLQRFDVDYGRESSAEAVPEPCTETNFDVSLPAAAPCIASADRCTVFSPARKHVSPQLKEEQDFDQNGEQEPEEPTKSKNKRPKRSKLKKQKALQRTTRCCLKRGTPSVSRSRSSTGSLEPPSGACGHDAMAAAMSPAAVALSDEAVRLLQSFPAVQFFGPNGKRAQAGFVPKTKGFLDLYSGASGVARYMSRKFGIWVLTVDYSHGPHQDLLDSSMQRRILDCIRAGAFLGVGAAPECASFSRAVTPAVRSALEPWGKKNLSANMVMKVDRGNQHAAFVLQVVLLCMELKLPYWVENPDGSFLWLLPPWTAHRIGTFQTSYRFDQCRFGTGWRKRTRIATSTALAGVRQLCLGGHSHQVLRGRSVLHGTSWTRVAQVYPKTLCKVIGDAMGLAAGLVGRHGKFDVAACSRCTHSRIGEAAHPGPRLPKDVGPRDPHLLEDVRLIEPSTAARQDKMLRELEAWLSLHLSPDTITELYLCPSLAVEVLKKYALHLFASGRRLYELRYTLIAIQHRFPHWKSAMGPAWAMVSKWEMYQPLQHRKPLPELLFKAMFVLATLKGWRRWSATLLLAFEGIARIGEVLSAKRCDLLLPCDLQEHDHAVAFVKIRQPKTRFRGRGRVQHLKISNGRVIPYLERVFGHLDPCLSLFPLTTYAFRKRWDYLLDTLSIPPQQRPTPASVRGGGAILAYRRGEPVADILWRMRLTSQPTLASYLQELAADSLLAHLHPRVRSRVSNLAALFSLTLQSPG